MPFSIARRQLEEIMGWTFEQAYVRCKQAEDEGRIQLLVNDRQENLLIDAGLITIMTIQMLK